MTVRPVTRANVSAALADLSMASEALGEAERQLPPAHGEAAEAALAYLRFATRRIAAARTLLGEQS